MATDITLLHKALEERRHLAETLDQRVLLRTAQLERANREMETFTHMVSHEMRAPIARMEGFGRMLSDATGEDQVRRTAERIGEAARRMRAVIDGLLQLTRISLDPARMETVDLGSLTLRVLEDLRQESPARTDCVSVDVDLQVEGDPRLLGIALRNLLQNALKFTRDTPCPAVTVIARNQKERPLLVVRDNGVGFDMAWAGALFQPFTRLHPEADFPGLGLGLAMVRLVVTKHGGQVWAVSSPGEGAAFHLQFPP
jgi:signal transduction histidine kinase